MLYLVFPKKAKSPEGRGGNPGDSCSTLKVFQQSRGAPEPTAGLTNREEGLCLCLSLSLFFFSLSSSSQQQMSTAARTSSFHSLSTSSNPLKPLYYDEEEEAYMSARPPQKPSIPPTHRPLPRSEGGREGRKDEWRGQRQKEEE